MTKDRLEQLKDLYGEIAHYENKLSKMNPLQYAADTAKDYRTGKGLTIVIRGYSDYEKKELAKTYKRRLKKLGKEVIAVESWIETIKDSEMRTILSMYYIEDLTQSEIGQFKHMDRSTVSLKIKDFLAKI